MNKHVEQFNALGQEDRLKIFRLLVRAGPHGNCVDDIKRRLKMPGSTLSHHLDALTRSRLLNARRAGRFIFYAVNWNETAGLIRLQSRPSIDRMRRASNRSRAACRSMSATSLPATIS